MNRFQKLAALTLATALGLVTIGVIVRATDSGLGCPDWPLCHGQIIPALDDTKAWIEWIHRSVAVLIGFEILALAILAVREYRDRRSILLGSLGAVGLVGFQAWLGRETVRLGNSGESVTAHLAAALALLALLVFLTVRAGYPAKIGGRGGSQRFTLLAAFVSAVTFALLLFGSQVTATASALVFLDWPLMSGSLVPDVTDVNAAHVLHRWVAAFVGVVVAVLGLVAWRTQRDHPTLVRLALGAAALFAVQVVIGGAQVLTQLAEWTQTLHLALGAVIWTMLTGLTITSFYTARVDVRTKTGATAGEGTDMRGPGTETPSPRTKTDTLRAYVALTKPRIIELLLVTTVPAMVLATRDLPGASGGIDWSDWGVLVFWTMLGGTLAAGSANAINCYLDRDIDLLMTRTRRRPLPAHQVEPERAVVFGIALGIISFAVMVWFVNLTAAFLTLLAIAFYVVIYTMLLKRTTPQNIVIGGAAGALPPVIGWAAVTGNVGLPAIMLFLIVFYWTPPHFWALSLRIRKDYAAAGIPMLPVVKGIPETTRQIGLYAILMVAISLALFTVGRMGLIYLMAAVGLGAIFLWQAYGLWRRGSSEEASTAGAIRLYKYSISYLSLLFLAVAVDALVLIPV
ncbi:MAG: protoheme IX farnesyltransferase [Thermomicrobiales bacterium]|nr:MAG: protoheme IX farnesyltransferase [Thermomicrobiales bacterium]